MKQQSPPKFLNQSNSLINPWGILLSSLRPRNSTDEFPFSHRHRLNGETRGLVSFLIFRLYYAQRRGRRRRGGAGDFREAARSFCISKISGWPRRNYLASLQRGSIIRLLANACRVSSCPPSHNSSGYARDVAGISLCARLSATHHPPSRSFCAKLLPRGKKERGEKWNCNGVENIDEHRGIPSINVSAHPPPPPPPLSTRFEFPSVQTISTK